MPLALSMPTALRYADSGHLSSRRAGRLLSSPAVALALVISRPFLTETPAAKADGEEFSGDPSVRPLATMQALTPGDPARARARNEAICAGLPLARKLARGFQRSGEPLEDLVQVATVGLIKSVDRFDVHRGVPFARYAAPTIVGELKRYVRDVGWRLRIPRRLQELHLEIVGAIPTLTQRLGHTPTVREIAADLRISESDVNAGLQCAAAYRPHSLNAPTFASHSSGPNDGTELGETIGSEDEELNHVIDRAALRQLIATLPEREQRILALRFVNDLNQSQIASQIGISAMHVSRLLRRSLALLRAGLLAEAT